MFDNTLLLNNNSHHSTNLTTKISHANNVLYDLEVENNHNFCAGTEGIVVHNFAIAFPLILFGSGEIIFASGILKTIIIGAFSIVTFGTIKKITKAKEELECYTPEFIDHEKVD